MSEQLRLKPDGEWHRRASVGDGTTTACGAQVCAFAGREAGADHLCAECFTPSEIERGELELIAREADSHDIRQFDPDDEATDPNGAITIAEIERAKP